MFQQPFCGSFPKANSYRWRQHLLLAAFSFLLLTLSGTTLPRVSGRANATKALAQVPGPCAQQPLRLYNTGVNADGTALLAAGQTDPHYTLLNTSPLSPNALVVNQPQGNGWLANNTSSAWIGPKSTDVSPAGFYTYRTSFQINSPCSADSAVIRGAWASDNEAEILVNGQATSITTGPADFGSLQAFTLTGFNNGLNTLDFRVRNRAASTGADTATGLRVELSGNVLCCGCATPPGELADWWPFDEPSGSAAANDRSGVNNVGVYKNGPQPSPGFVGNAALCFNGTNSYVEVANHPEINFIGNCANDFAEAFTIDAWVKTTQSEGLAVILDKRDSTINGYHLYLFNGRLGFQMGGGGTFENYVAPSAGPQFVNVADGKWHFIAVTASRCLAARGRLYVDGKPVLTFTPLSAELNNSAPLNIGRRDPAHGDIYFNGCLDELEIFKRALSEDEVLSIFQAGSNGKCKVNCAQKNIALTPADLQKPVWAANTPYPSVTFTASGGTAPYTITQVGGTLPPGMSFSNGVLSGTPTTPGTYTFTVLVVDADGCKFEKRYTITIINCALALAPATLPNPSVLVGVPFGPVPFTVAGVGGGCQPLTFSISAGALPPGMTLTPAGQLVGTPTQVGTYSFTVKVIDMCGCMATREYRLEVRCPDLTLNPATLPNGAPGQSYTQVLTITGGGFGPFTWTVDSGTLPPGMTLTANGQLTGTPTTSGMYTFKIKVTDAFGCMAMREYTIKIECPLVTIPGLFNTGVNDSGQRLIIGALDAHYQLTAFGGPAPAVAVGRLDNSWVTPGPNAQWISFGQAGTNATTFVYRLQFKLSNCEANSVVIKGRYAADNGAAISVNGGATQFATPTPLGHTVYTDFTLTTGFVAGVNTLEFQVRNQGSVTGLLVEFTEATARCCACSTIAIAPGALPTATAGANYSATLTATGGMAPYTFSATGLPTGFTLNSNGQLTGMSMTAGSFIIKVMVIDAKGCMAMRRYRLVVTCGQININPPTLPDTTVGTAYNQTLSATGGCGSYTFSAVTLAPGAPALPPGLTLSPQGVLSGTPAVCGAFVFEVKVTDKCGCMATRRYTLKVDGVTGPIAGLFNTGVDNSNNLLASGATDAHYLVKRPTTTTYGNAVTITPVAGWVTSSTARWITPTGQPDDFGQHRYRMTFNLAGCDLSTVQITGRYAADNSAYIGVNTSTVKLAPTPNSTGFKQFTPFTITAANGLTQNVNTLEFVVQNDDGPTGLLVEISGTAKCCPSFQMSPSRQREVGEPNGQPSWRINSPPSSPTTRTNTFRL